MAKYLITYKRRVSDTTEAMGFKKEKVKRRYRAIPVVLADLDGADLKALRANKHVLAVEADGIVSIPKDETLSAESTIAEDRAPWGITKVRAAEVHALGVKGAGIKVAVIDTGIDFNHPDLATLYKGGVNFVTPNTPPMDDHNHGTHCAGTVSAILDGQGVFGVAPSIELYAVKVLNAAGSGSWSAVISAYDWCIQNGMHVTSNSYGGSAGSVALETALNAAVDAGLLMIFAAGNNGVGAGGSTVGYPGKYAKAIAVSATDTNDVIAAFSSRGPEVACAAPGVAVESTIRNGAYGTMSGTSMACPHVAGACALALSKGRSAAEVRQRLTTTLVDLGVPGKDPLYGWGRMDTHSLVFAEDPNIPHFKSPITINASASSDPDGTITEHKFVTSAGQTLVGVQHTLSLAPGPYTLTLTVTDNQGATSSLAKQLIIDAVAPPLNQAPVASFTIVGG